MPNEPEVWINILFPSKRGVSAKTERLAIFLPAFDVIVVMAWLFGDSTIAWQWRGEERIQRKSFGISGKNFFRRVIRWQPPEGSFATEFADSCRVLNDLDQIHFGGNRSGCRGQDVVLCAQSAVCYAGEKGTEESGPRSRTE